MPATMKEVNKKLDAIPLDALDAVAAWLRAMADNSHLTCKRMRAENRSIGDSATEATALHWLKVSQCANLLAWRVETRRAKPKPSRKG